MKRYIMYLFFYSVGGFVLERIINVIFLGYWWDNSVLVGPYQPLYGNGVLLTILFFDFAFPRLQTSRPIKLGLLMLVAILSTALSEAGTGYFFEWLIDVRLWDYGQTFTCRLDYICVLPTSLFGVIGFFVVLYIHPIVKPWLDRVPNWLYLTIVTVVSIDIIYTFITLLT